MTAQEILKQVKTLYSGLQSYKDEGYVKSIYHPGKSTEHNRYLEFKTYFQRPIFFRFDWTEEGRNYFVGCDGNNAYEHYDSEESGVVKAPINKEGTNSDTTAENLGYAVAGATGISQGAAYYISSLLIPEVGGKLLTDDFESVVVGERSFNRNDCFEIRLNFTPHTGSANYLLISKKNLTVVGFMQDCMFDESFRVRREIVYSSIILDEQISIEQFDIP